MFNKSFFIFCLIVASVVVAFFLFNVRDRIREVDRYALEQYTVESAELRHAVCNDGSPAVYYHRPGDEGFEDKWVIWFEGGGGCGSEEGCAERAKTQTNLTTSEGTPRRITQGGILSIDPSVNPDFSQWNHVVLNYCSSDSWTGRVRTTVDGKQWFFEGKAIVESTIEDLKDEALFGEHHLGTATEVLVTGTSAGGGGAAQNLNDIASSLPNATVSGVIDSSWTVSVESENIDAVVHDEQLQAINDFRRNQLDQECVMQEARALDCQSVSSVYPYILPRTFIYIDQYDRVKLEEIFSIGTWTKQERQEFMSVYSHAVVDSLAGLEGVFSPQETFHGALTNSHFQDVLIDGYSYADVLGNWYFGKDGPITVIAPIE